MYFMFSGIIEKSYEFKGGIPWGMKDRKLRAEYKS